MLRRLRHAACAVHDRGAMRPRFCSHFSAAFLVLATGCATVPTQPPTPPSQETPAASAPGTAEPDELPPIMHGIDLTPKQIEDVIAMRADLRSKASAAVDAALDFGHSVAGAARLCKGDTPFMETDASRVVREGEEMREPILDAAQMLHKLLTPAQRKKLSDRLIDGDDWAKRERRNSSRTRDLGPAIDLSTMQMVQMLMKAAVLWSNFADKSDPWRVHYRTAITNFARDDFDVHNEPVAKAPAVALTLDFVRTGLRMLIPILEPKQCETLGKLIDQRVDEAGARFHAGTQ